MKIGCDITKIEKFAKMSPAFVQKYFTKSEREYIASKENKQQTSAGIFSAKEAVFKTFGINDFPILSEIEITHKNNIPAVKLHGIYEKFGETEVSISHDGEYAIAYALRKNP
ncbi:MAG: 4'-phosphopantetheinyl transferase superfamily protein [Bacillota bacterium]